MNLHSNSLRKNLRRPFASFQQKTSPGRGPKIPEHYFFFFALAGAALLHGFAAGFTATCFAGALASALATAGRACPLSPALPFLSLLLLSLGLGGSLMPDNLRRIFSRSSGVLPFPFNCIANICSTTASNFGPAGIPMRVNSSRTSAMLVRSGRHLFRYARIFESAVELRDSASKYASFSTGTFSRNLYESIAT